MTADLKPCPFCGAAPSRSYGGRSGNRIWCANERCQERPLIAAETWSGAASIWNPIATTVSDTGPGTSGLRTPQPGEAPRSSAPAPTMADLIDNLMHIEMLTATGVGLDPATTIDVHLLAAIGRAVDDDAAWHFRAPALPTHYGATRIQTVQRDFNDLRVAIRAHDGFAAEAAWDRCERWLGLWPLERDDRPDWRPIETAPISLPGGRAPHWVLVWTGAMYAIACREASGSWTHYGGFRLREPVAWAPIPPPAIGIDWGR